MAEKQIMILSLRFSKFILALTVLLIFTTFAVAQAGRTPQPENFNKTPTELVQTANSSQETKEKYKYIVAYGIANFVTEVNKFGEMGYQLTMVTNAPSGNYPHAVSKENQSKDWVFLAGILEFKNQKFDYMWSSGVDLGKVITGTEIAKKGGFYFREVFSFTDDNPFAYKSGSSNPSDAEKLIEQNTAETENRVLLFEREKDKPKLEVDYRLMSKGWSKQLIYEPNAEAEELTKNGFKLVGRVDVRTVLFEKRGSEVDSISSQVILLPGINSDKRQNRMSLFASQGFEVAFSDGKGAGMIKRERNQSTSSFLWMRGISTSKDFAADLQKAQKQKARYYRLNESAIILGIDNWLIFKLDANLKTSFSYQLCLMNGPDLKPEIIVKKKLKPILPETAKSDFENLIKEGYVPRELFHGRKHFTVLFEKED